MLSHKPWKVEAILRLVLSVIICMCAGSVAAAMIYYEGGSRSLHLFYGVSVASLAFMAVTLQLLSKPLLAVKTTRAVAITLAAFYAALVLAAYAGSLAGPLAPIPSVGQMLIAMLSVQGAALVLIAFFLYQQRMTWRTAFGFLNDWKHAVLWGAIIAGLFLPLAWAMQKGGDTILRHLSQYHVKPEVQVSVQTLKHASGMWDRVVLGIVTIILAPVAEETFFRGILYPTIKQAGFPRLALWTTSLLFAVIHKNLVVFVPLLALAIALTMLYERFDNLLAPITAHALFNAVNFTLLYMVQTA
jgi:membrane protease YdiL (CAAX protease family)